MGWLYAHLLNVFHSVILIYFQIRVPVTICTNGHHSTGCHHGLWSGLDTLPRWILRVGTVHIFNCTCCSDYPTSYLSNVLLGGQTKWRQKLCPETQWPWSELLDICVPRIHLWALFKVRFYSSRVNEWVRLSEWVNEWVNEWVSEWMSKWVSEWVSESEWVNETERQTGKDR